MNYQRHYDIPLLDDIHNYFPALLYAPVEQFRSVADLLSYVRQQVRQQFDLFSAGQQAYAPNAIPQVLQTPPRAQSPLSPPPLRRMPQDPLMEILSPFATSDIIQLLTRFQSIPYPPPPMEPVIVRPTADQIAAGTAIEVMDAEEDVCAICQDEIPLGSQVRTIRVCDHRFHVGCIDTWFQRDVRCPSCRHDIRELE